MTDSWIEKIANSWIEIQGTDSRTSTSLSRLIDSSRKTRMRTPPTYVGLALVKFARHHQTNTCTRISAQIYTSCHYWISAHITHMSSHYMFACMHISTQLYTKSKITVHSHGNNDLNAMTFQWPYKCWRIKILQDLLSSSTQEIIKCVRREYRFQTGNILPGPRIPSPIQTAVEPRKQRNF